LPEVSENEAIILARLEEIERQNQQMLALLTRMSGASVETPQPEGGMTAARRMELRQLAFEIVRNPGRPGRPRKKKTSNREARV
jgi:hypothetical protein